MLTQLEKIFIFNKSSINHYFIDQINNLLKYICHDYQVCCEAKICHLYIFM